MSDAKDNDASGSYEGSFEPTNFDSGVVHYILFRSKNGEKEPDSRSDSRSERSLADWRSNLLTSKKNNELSADRKAVLASIGFKFPTARDDAFDTQFDEMFSAVLKWKVKAGVDHLLVPRSAKVDGKNVGSWINHMRKTKKKFDNGESTFLNANHISKLDAAGMEWDDAHEAKWNMRFAELQQFFMANGHSYVPQSMPGLGPWVSNQRRKHNMSDLSEDKIEKLKGLNFGF